MAKLANTKAVRYFIEAKEELQKVTWPTKKDTTRYSLLVIVMCLVLAVFFGVADYAFNLGLEQLIQVSTPETTETVNVDTSVNDIDVTSSDGNVIINTNDVGAEETPSEATDPEAATE